MHATNPIWMKFEYWKYRNEVGKMKDEGVHIIYIRVSRRQRFAGESKKP